MTVPAPHRVAVLAIPDTIGYDLTIPTQVFGTARGAGGERLYEVTVCGVSDTSPVPTTSGFGIVPAAGPEAIEQADTVIVPGTDSRGPRNEGVLYPPLAAALDRIPDTARVMSICTGAFVLGASGRLDGRRATTHWSHTTRFRELYPAVLLDDSVLYVDEGDLLSSAGLAAGNDLCLHVLRRDHGAEVANAVARYCVVPPWRAGGQAQFIEKPVPEPCGSTATTRAWALARLESALSLTELAAHAHLSTRTFARRFHEETGMSPRAWLIQQRVHYARRLLETSGHSVEEIARRSGLGSAATLRHHFGAQLGIAPLAYRRTFTPSA
ncbi:GlxA family transcriptional regulator [Sciscionella marina]|uniref:GlxA family transcriptional regulator n=1 Tax=Sciscionella marina TaxID=508770 RepID=UPI000371AFA9|nr:helix-turn-helix domain-containing protein [Sciscionella marina]